MDQNTPKETTAATSKKHAAGAQREAARTALVVLALFVKAGLVASNGEARRQIKGGGLRVNDAPVTDERMMLNSANLNPEGVIKLSLGRKRHVLLKPA